MNTKELKQAAADAAAHAADTTQDLLGDSVAKAADILGEAQKKAAALLEDAQKVAGPAAKEAGARAREAGVKAADFASRQLDAWEPHIKGALDKVSPAVEAATDKVSDDLLPRLQTMLHDAAGSPVVQEALDVVQPKRAKRRRLKKVGKFLALGAVVAGAVAAVRHFLTPKDDGWTAHEPSKAYVNNNEGFQAPRPAAEPVAEESTDTENAAQDTNAAESTETPDYGEGSYIGENPPEGFVIKGNERSKKYHVAGTGNYERTIPDVWFNSEEAAEAAGFTKAQR